MTNLRQHAEHLIVSRALLAPGDRLLVGVSGGLDSIVLLHLLAQLAPKHRWRLHAAHLNHHLRGAASTADQRHVQKLAAQLRLPCTIGHATSADAGDIRALARANKISVEMAARTIRHQFLGRTARRHRITTIALAHHADDQLEHFLLRLLRGSSPQGLVGMPLVGPSPYRVPGSVSRVQIIRPLLPFTKGELRAYARVHHLTWREDATNFSADIPRNRIRHRLIPYLEKHHQPALAHVIARFTETLRAETEYIGAVAQAWLDQLPKIGRSATELHASKSNRRLGPALEGFDTLPLAIQRRVIHDQLTRPELSVPPAALDFDLIETLRTEAPGTPVTISSSRLKSGPPFRLSLHRDSGGKLHLTKVPVGPLRATSARRKEARVPDRKVLKVSSVGGHTIYGNRRITWAIAEAPPSPLTAIKTTKVEPVADERPASASESLDADAVGPVITLRKWQPGDRFQPIGMIGPVKLQDWFTNLKIPREKRHQLLLALDANGRIFWVEGCRISELHKVTAATRRILKWSYTAQPHGTSK